jgi:copper chaperone
MEMEMIESATLTVTGMKCGGCENNVTIKLKALEGVKSVTASSKNNEVNIEFDSDIANLKAIAQAISESGYTVVEDI